MFIYFQFILFYFFFFNEWFILAEHLLNDPSPMTNEDHSKINKYLRTLSLASR